MEQGCSSKPDDSENLYPPHLSSDPSKCLVDYGGNSEEITNSLSGPSLPTRGPRVKIFDLKFKRPQMNEYTREGFDEKDVAACLNQEIRPADLSCAKIKAKYVKMAKKAIAVFNKKYKKKSKNKLQFVELVKATFQCWMGTIYYLTFTAKTSLKLKSETYQAILADHCGVLAFRLMPKRVKPEGPKKWFWDDSSGNLGYYDELFEKEERKRMRARQKIKGEQASESETYDVKQNIEDTH